MDISSPSSDATAFAEHYIQNAAVSSAQQLNLDGWTREYFQSICAFCYDVVARLDTEGTLATAISGGRGILPLFEPYLVPCRAWYDASQSAGEGRDKPFLAGILCTPGKLVTDGSKVFKSQCPGIGAAQTWFEDNYAVLKTLGILDSVRGSGDYHTVEVLLVYCLLRSSDSGNYYLSSGRLRDLLADPASSSSASTPTASPDSSSSASSASASVGSGSSSSSKRGRVSSSSSPPTTTTSRRVRAPPDRYGSSSSNFTDLTRDNRRIQCRRGRRIQV